MVLIRNAAFPGPKLGFWTPEPKQEAPVLRHPAPIGIFAPKRAKDAAHRADCDRLLAEMTDWARRRGKALSWLLKEVRLSHLFPDILRDGTAKPTTIYRVRAWLRAHP